ncbi:hypothetical protein G6F38_004671 [Rhizopus arrhizus]|nr:hypothetical protein G6F38_004671 [Rhizopus arrhizus]
MDLVVDEEPFSIETISSRTQFLMNKTPERPIHTMVPAAAEKHTARQLGIHVRATQRWIKRYREDPESIFKKKKKPGRHRILGLRVPKRIKKRKLGSETNAYSTGEVVEDALYDFGVTCKHEYLAYQFIVDPFNKQMESIFDEAELQEIQSANVKPMPMMPTPLRDYIASFNKKTPNEIRDVIDTRQPW